MKLWPFQKKSAPQDAPADTAPVAVAGEPAAAPPAVPDSSVSAPQSGGEYELVIPIVPEAQPAPVMAQEPPAAPQPPLHLVHPPPEPTPEPVAEAPAESGMPLLKTDLPRLHLVHPVPQAAPESAAQAVEAADTRPAPWPEPEAVQPVAQVVDFGDYYGDAYDLPDPSGVFENAPKPVEPVAQSPEPATPPLAREFARHEPTRIEMAGYADSIADALDDFEQRIIWQDNRFLNKSINDLVDRYFAQCQQESGREAV